MSVSICYTIMAELPDEDEVDNFDEHVDELVSDDYWGRYEFKIDRTAVSSE